MQPSVGAYTCATGDRRCDANTMGDSMLQSDTRLAKEEVPGSNEDDAAKRYTHSPVSMVLYKPELKAKHFFIEVHQREKKLETLTHLLQLMTVNKVVIFLNKRG